jgi:parallel beta-helix repeat protein
MKFLIFMIALALLLCGAEAKYSPAISLATNANITMAGGYLAGAKFDPSDSVASAVVYKKSNTVRADFTNGTNIYTGTAGTNDAAAINYALNKTPAGATVVIRRGSYTIENTLLIDNQTGKDLIGESRTGTRLNAKTALNKEMIYVATSTGVKIADLKLSGNSAGQSDTTHTDGVRIGSFCSNTMVINCEIVDMKYNGIHMKPDRTSNNTYMGLFLYNSIASCTGSGILVEYTATAGADDGLIQGNDIGLNYNGVKLDHANAWSVIGNKLWGSNANGQGLYLVTVTSAEISGNRIDYNFGNGVALTSCSNIVFTGNMVYLNSYTHSSVAFGVYVADSTNNLFSGNTMSYSTGETERYGFAEGGTSNYNVYCDNLMRSHTIGAYYSLGAQNTLSNNIG